MEDLEPKMAAMAPVAATDLPITFPNIGKNGDCFGDALRGDGKDASKFPMDINGDGTLNFHGDGVPNMKLINRM